MLFKHCNQSDQKDSFEDFFAADSLYMQHNPSLLGKDAVTPSSMDYLGQISVRYPIRNKAKSINTNIVNYQFEGNNNIK